MMRRLVLSLQAVCVWQVSSLRVGGIWLDARKPGTSVDDATVDAVLTTMGAEVETARVEYHVKDSDVFLGDDCVGRIVEIPDPLPSMAHIEKRKAPNAIESAVRCGNYQELVLDGSCDAELLEFALGRAEHCRSISGVDVRIVQRTPTARDVDAVARCCEKLGRAVAPRLLVPADAGDDAWARAAELSTS